MPRTVLIFGAVAGLVAVFLPGGAVRPDRPDADVLVCAVGLVLVAGATFLPRQRFARYWVVRLVTAGLAVAVAARAVVLLLVDVDAGLPGSSTAVLAGAATVVVLGLAVDAVRPLRTPGTAAVVVVLVAAAVAGALLTPGWPVRADRAAAVRPAAMAGHPGTRPWSWRSPDEVIEVVPAGAGVVVGVTGGELVALDGPTGRPRWHYTRVGAHLHALRATPDRTLVVAAFAPGDRTGYGGFPFTGAQLLVVLDAVTGAVIRESTEDYDVTSWQALMPTNSVLPVRERVGYNDFRLHAVDLRTGAERWTWSPPRGCTAPIPDVEGNTAHLVLTPVHCGARKTVEALDERTGGKRWERTVAAEGYSVLPGGEFLAVGTGDPVGLREVDRFLRVDDGRELPTVDATPWFGIGPHPVLNLTPSAGMTPAVVDLPTGTTHPLPMMTCPEFVANATTSSAYLQVCQTGDRTSLMWQDIAGGPVGNTPIRWARKYVDQRYEHPPTTLSGLAVAIIPAPGAIVLARSAGTEVLGYP
jgi:outer membrane protein assembly factor BamB